VGADGLVADGDARRNFIYANALGQQAEDLGFPFGQKQVGGTLDTRPSPHSPDRQQCGANFEDCCTLLTTS
jgi:hypothetical protein